jgi:ATP-dependent HslUV protease ATP-binding subunit HslU
MDVAVKQTREQELVKVRHRAEDAAEERLLDLLLPGSREQDSWAAGEAAADTRQKLRKRLREGQLDDRQVEIEVTLPQVGVEIMAPPGMEELTQQLQGMFQNMGGQRTRRRQVRVAEALRLLTDEEAAKFVNEDDIKRAAVANAEQNGIVFIDEIDKITQRGGDRGGSGGEVSREGVQRDLLPLIEGSTVTTKHGQVRTDHILFIASGAFHLSKPSDLIPEMQGRLPIRVELDSLRVEDFERILTDTDAALTEQASALLATEGVTLQFAPDGVRRLAQIAYEVNERTENIGARRLHTVMERLLEDLSFAAADRSGSTVNVDAAYVDGRLKDLAGDQDLSRYIL